MKLDYRTVVPLIAVIALAGLLVGGCNTLEEDSGGGNKFSDNRSDADLKAVADQALVDAQANDPGFSSLNAIDATNASSVGLETESETVAAATAGAASASLRLPTSDLLIRRQLEGPVRELLQQALNTGVPQDGGSLKIDTTIACSTSGSVVVSGEFQSSGDETNGTVKYVVTVVFNACEDFGGSKWFGETIYAGVYKATASSDGTSGTLESDLTVNGGIAYTDGTNYYNFIIRDEIAFVITITDSTFTFDYSLVLRVDDGTLNVTCTASGDLGTFFVDETNFSCTTVASTL